MIDLECKLVLIDVINIFVNMGWCDDLIYFKDFMSRIFLRVNPNVTIGGEHSEHFVLSWNGTGLKLQWVRLRYINN